LLELIIITRAIFCFPRYTTVVVVVVIAAGQNKEKLEKDLKPIERTKYQLFIIADAAFINEHITTAIDDVETVNIQIRLIALCSGGACSILDQSRAEQHAAVRARHAEDVDNKAARARESDSLVFTLD